MLEIIKDNNFPFKDLKELYRKIFYEDFLEEKFNLKKQKYKIDIFKILKNKSVIGFIIGYPKESNYHLWIGGIIEEHQNKGYFSRTLDFISEYLIGKAKKITVTSFNHRKNMLRLLLKKNYNIVKIDKGNYGDGKKILFEKKLYKENEIRFSLTNSCNFKCFFCHGDGFISKNIYVMEEKSILTLIKDLNDNNYYKFTITGGEPLLKKKMILNILKYCYSLDSEIKIKIITNGFYLNDDFIKEIKFYKKNLSFNISLHSMSSEEFDLITKTKGKFYIVLSNIKKAIENNINIKINCVFMKTQLSMDIKNKIFEIIDKSFQIGIRELTFLELLVPIENHNLYENYVSFEKIKELVEYYLSSRYILEKIKEKSKRKKVYFLKKENKYLKINIFRLTCRNGCEECLKNKDRLIGADNKYYPCMMSSDIQENISNEKSIEKVFEAGEEKLNELIKIKKRKFL